jgi:hypothetical protein
MAVAREIARQAPFDPWRGDESIADAYLKRRPEPRRR